MHSRWDGRKGGSKCTSGSTLISFVYDLAAVLMLLPTLCIYPSNHNCEGHFNYYNKTTETSIHDDAVYMLQTDQTDLRRV